jgi:pyruvate/2-oxoacid:ferredoxin oxidoreductase beta subunit
MRKAIKEAIEWPGFAFVDVASQCIENNGRRIGFASANDMLQNYRTEYKAAPPGSKHLEPHQLGIVKGEPLPVGGPADTEPTNGHGQPKAEKNGE